MSRVLTIDRLSIDIRVGSAGTRRVVNDVSLAIDSGKIAALVGESGSGKTLIGRAVMRLLPPVAAMVGGDIAFDGASLAKLDAERMRSLRGRQIGAVFQEPMVSLNPALTIGFQMMEAMRLHERVSQAEAKRRCMTMLEKVRIADPEEALRAYPRQFSGGMRQRIMLASVLAMRPRLLIADEPTTALDALIRKEIMDLMVSLTREIGTSVLLISHDLAMVAQYSDDVTVLRQGEAVERGSPDDLLLHPTHEYTRALMDALPARAPTSGVTRTPLVEIDDLCVDFHRKTGFWSRRAAVKRAVDQASLSIYDGEVLAVVGESGSGKTTIGRTLLRLCDSSSGSIRFDGQDFESMDADAIARFRTRTQMVFQDPYSSLDPRMTLGAIVAEGLRHVADIDKSELQRRAQQMLEEVGLSASYVERYPHELSGGQRQRVCIARAVVARPRFIVADEPVSALDVTIQRQVLQLLTRLQEKYGFTYLFISHDLGVVEQMADRVAVMFRGRVLEIGPRNTIFDAPLHPYTMRLLEATPRLVRRTDGAFELHTFPTHRRPAPAGHGYFNNGCIPGAQETAGAPLMIEVSPGHSVCCARA